MIAYNKSNLQKTLIVENQFLPILGQTNNLNVNKFSFCEVNGATILVWSFSLAMQRFILTSHNLT